jgi:hypothetical protein
VVASTEPQLQAVQAAQAAGPAVVQAAAVHLIMDLLAVQVATEATASP